MLCRMLALQVDQVVKSILLRVIGCGIVLAVLTITFSCAWKISVEPA